MKLYFSQRNQLALWLFFTTVLIAVPVQANPDYENVYYNIVDIPKNDVLNIRKEPDFRSSKIGQIPESEECVMVIDTANAPNKKKWYQVNYQDIIGWVNAHYLVLNPDCLENRSNSPPL
ncbi:MAG: SH3 domain-containing protein [Thiomargarita sp.]|nr:SH3 domain-containing protein [Thiomargarita sp.]